MATPEPDRVRDAARRHALAHPAWGHRKVWAMYRHDGLPVSAATVLSLLREEVLLLEANYQWERCQLAAGRMAAFAVEPTGSNQVWQLASPTSRPPPAGPGGWPAARGYQLGWHVPPTANQHDAIGAVELALAEVERLAGRPLHELAPRDPDGNVLPVMTIVTDSGGPYRSFRFEAFIAAHLELRQVRTCVRSPGQNGSRERGFRALKYERLFLEEIDDILDLNMHAARYRADYNTVHPHEALALNRPHDVHVGGADPRVPNFSPAQNPANCLTRGRWTR